MKKIRIVAAVLCVILMAANVAFIWINSMLPASQSAQLSSGLLSRLFGLFSVFGPNAERVLRKCAHFSEFASFGFLSCLLWVILRQLSFQRVLHSGLASLLVSCIDETIQIYSFGRSSSLIDVWIDFSGAIVGIILVVALHFLFRKTDKL